MEGSVVRRTWLADVSGKCREWMRQEPCWSPEDLRSETRTVSDAEVEDVAALVSSDSFQALGKTLGGAPPGQRFYAETITVHTPTGAKTVVYQSFPEASPAPSAFNAVRARLRKLARSSDPR